MLDFLQSIPNWIGRKTSMTTALEKNAGMPFGKVFPNASERFGTVLRAVSGLTTNVQTAEHDWTKENARIPSAFPTNRKRTAKDGQVDPHQPAPQKRYRVQRNLDPVFVRMIGGKWCFPAHIRVSREACNWEIQTPFFGKPVRFGKPVSYKWFSHI